RLHARTRPRGLPLRAARMPREPGGVVAGRQLTRSRWRIEALAGPPGQAPGHGPPRSRALELVDLHAHRGDGQRAGRGVERRLPGADLLRLPERILRIRAGAGELPAAPRRLRPEALQREREAVRLLGAV